MRPPRLLCSLVHRSSSPVWQASFQRAMLGNGEDDAFDPIPAVHTGPAANEPTRKKPTYLVMGQEVTKKTHLNKHIEPILSTKP